MQNDNSQAHGGGEQGEKLEGSLTDGGSLPGAAHRDEDRSFGAGRRDEEGEEAQATPAAGSSGSTGASKADSGGGDAHLGSGGTGGSAGGDQLTSTTGSAPRDTGLPPR